MHRVHRSVAWSSRLLVAAAALLAASPARDAHAACNVTACTAAPVIAACCSATSCMLDGTITVDGPTCTFDFGARNVALSGSGKIVAQGKTITLQLKSLKLMGLIDVRGPSGAAAGNVTIVTTGMTGLAYSQEGGNSAVIDASSTAGPGGMITIRADGDVAFSNGSVKADGGPLASAGAVAVSTSVGNLSVQISISASSGTNPTPGKGFLSFIVPGTAIVGGSGRLIADLGAVFIDAGGMASFADGSVVQANVGGDITISAATVQGLGEMRAGGDFGTISLDATGGPIFLSRLSQGLTVGNAGGVTLTTDSDVPDGTLTVDTPILANGADVEITSAANLIVSKKIDVTGVNLGDGTSEGGGDVTLSAAGDIQITKAIVGSDPETVQDITIEADGDVTIAGNLELKGALDSDGGDITVTAGGDITVQDDIALNVSGADSSSSGNIELTAGGNVTITTPVELIADGSPIGAAGSITILAGIDEFGAPRLPGGVLLQGDIKANGHSTSANIVDIQGCSVSIPSGAMIDITGDTGSTNVVTARTSLAIGGTLKASAANQLEFPAGTTPSLPGSFTPTRSAGPCTNGTVTADGCALPTCTDFNVPAACLYPCPQCGDDQVAFPETCEIGSGSPFCTGSDFCDQHCRLRSCTDVNPCSDNACDPTIGCTQSPVANGTTCNDNTVCNGLEQCSNGACVPAPGSVPSCGSDQNPCTTDGCDAVTGCFHTPLDGAGIAGCDDNNPCTGTETCVAGQCQAGTLVQCPMGESCNPANGQCEGAGSCTTPAQCDDGNPCTDDLCQANTCSNPTIANGTGCDDGNVCNGVRTCQAGVCQPGTPLVCNDGNPCTTDSCDATNGCETNPVAGCCLGAGDCNDSDACTTDACTGNECQHGAISCADNNVCTNDSCNAQTGCQNVVDPTCCQGPNDCTDDGDVCTDTQCIANRCQHAPSPLCCVTPADCAADPDNNPCTDNDGACTSNRCGSTPLTGSACGTPCNPATCESGSCVADPPTDCGDNDPCTADVCTDDQGCTHSPIPLCCLATSECIDTNACTIDTCDLDAGRCEYDTPDPTCAPCAGGDPFECGPRCSNACVAGRCEEMTASCDDNDPCTADACDAAAGCGHTPLDGTAIAGCDDGQACNGDERCVAGTCVPSELGACDDGDACTDNDSTTCNDPGVCEGTQKTGFPSVGCRTDDMRVRLVAATAEQVKEKTRTKLLRRIDKLGKKIIAAQATTKCAKQKRLLTSAARQLRSLQRTINRISGSQIDADLGLGLALRAGEAAGKTDAVRAGLGC